MIALFGWALAAPVSAEVALLQSLAPGPPDDAPAGAVLEGVPDRIGGLPVRVDRDVATWVGLYRGPLRDSTAGWLDRLDAERETLRFMLAGVDLPEGLVVVPVVESGLLPEATSTTGCAGTWQLSAPTARALGLRVDGERDERRDPLLSAAAAIELLEQLHAHFGDWDLALAAYNAGQGTIDAAVAKAGVRSWAAVAPHLGSEPRHFVAKVHAMAIVDADRAGLAP